ncbi:MAG: helix-turn-helix transcriptional regulator [Candidatus Atribacteria bacterium]|nr:helix-turn-helix transcriptional regulator [Candidatus Atribacteria bacterium]
MKPKVKLNGERLKEARRLRRLTQVELGDLILMSNATVRNYEKGRTCTTMVKVQALAIALEVRAAWLLGGSHE